MVCRKEVWLLLKKDVKHNHTDLMHSTYLFALSVPVLHNCCLLDSVAWSARSHLITVISFQVAEPFLTVWSATFIIDLKPARWTQRMH